MSFRFFAVATLFVNHSEHNNTIDMGDVVISAVDIIALDIGTSSSRVAIYKADGADVVADSDGHR